MAPENKPKPSAANKGRKRKQYLPNNKPVRKRGAYPLRPGIQGFFITCDGGRERQAAHEAIDVIDTFYEELVHGKSSGGKTAGIPDKPMNKKITFSYSDDDEEEDNDDAEEGNEEREEGEKDEGSKPGNEEKEEGEKDEGSKSGNGKEEGNEEKEEGEKDEGSKPDNGKEEDNEGTEEGEKEKGSKSGNGKEDDASHKIVIEETVEDDGGKDDGKSVEAEEPPSKKQCLETETSKGGTNGKEEKSIDQLIEAELEELGDKSKRRFLNLDSGCNGVVIIQMRKIDGDPNPKDIVQHMMTSVASTRKHMSRFILRVLPIQVSCYSSEEEISRSMKPLVEQYFPAETENPKKFAVLYEARANTGVDRMKIINSVAKSVPAPHKVDLSSPEITIVVEIVKTVCLIGVAENYKELSKFNIRQLTTSK